MFPCNRATRVGFAEQEDLVESIDVGWADCCRSGLTVLDACRSIRTPKPRSERAIYPARPFAAIPAEYIRIKRRLKKSFTNGIKGITTHT